VSALASVGEFQFTGAPIATTRASRGLVFNHPTHKKRSYQKRKSLNHHAVKSVVVFL
jgi:hypothetical protein